MLPLVKVSVTKVPSSPTPRPPAKAGAKARTSPRIVAVPVPTSQSRPDPDPRSSPYLSTKLTPIPIRLTTRRRLKHTTLILKPVAVLRTSIQLTQTPEPPAESSLQFSRTAKSRQEERFSARSGALFCPMRRAYPQAVVKESNIGISAGMAR